MGSGPLTQPRRREECRDAVYSFVVQCRIDRPHPTLPNPNCCNLQAGSCQATVGLDCTEDDAALCTLVDPSPTSGVALGNRVRRQQPEASPLLEAVRCARRKKYAQRSALPSLGRSKLSTRYSGIGSSPNLPVMLLPPMNGGLPTNASNPPRFGRLPGTPAASGTSADLRGPSAHRLPELVDGPVLDVSARPGSPCFVQRFACRQH